MGPIGAALAPRARAFDMDIVYPQPPRPVAARARGAQRCRCDPASTSCWPRATSSPCTARTPTETHHLIDAAALGRMRRDGVPRQHRPRAGRRRGDPGRRAVAHGVIAGATLDVYEREPVVHPTLLELKNVRALPHLGSATVETRAAMADAGRPQRRRGPGRRPAAHAGQRLTLARLGRHRRHGRRRRDR